MQDFNFEYFRLDRHGYGNIPAVFIILNREKNGDLTVLDIDETPALDTFISNEIHLERWINACDHCDLKISVLQDLKDMRNPVSRKSYKKQLRNLYRPRLQSI